MITKTSRSTWDQLLASGACLVVPMAALPSNVEFNTVASWYGPGFHGKKTASGELYDQNKLTAANKELPFGTKLQVKNLKNGRSCVVVINDRGPYVHGRGLDLSREAARRIGMQGTAPVYCCTFNPAKQASPAKPSTDIQAVDVTAMLPPSAMPFRAMSPQAVPSHGTSSQATPSRAVPHHRGLARQHVHAFQYVAYSGAHRIQYESVTNSNRFVRNYGA